MRHYSIVQIGIGKIGKAFAEMIHQRSGYLKQTYGVDLAYQGFTSTEADQKALAQALENASAETIFVDTTASDQTIPFMLTVLEKGGSVVMSNKKALTGTTTQYDSLVTAYPGRVYFETTVCAGLPIIGTLQRLIDAGDEITSIEGCLSGTLSFLCSALERGVSYSKAIREAKEHGFTEPDPREDLSGRDVARKALILARIMGMKMELSDIALEPLFSEQFKDLSVEEFMEAASTENDYYRMQFKYANDENNTLRYMATITKNGVAVELKAVPRISPLGTLNGPESKLVIHTKWYASHPLVIQGPGAGAAVTAAGLFAELMAIITTK